MTFVSRKLHLRRLSMPVTMLAIGVVFGCYGCAAGSHSRDTTSRPAAPALGLVELTGSGINGARFGSPAHVVQELLTKILGAPDHVRFGGCELGGPSAIYSRRSWSWGALTLTFTNNATKATVVPGRFLSWTVGEHGVLPSKVRLPDGLGISSSPEDVRATVPVKSAHEGLPGAYEITTLDGVTYGFNKPFHHASVIDVNAPSCE